MRIRVALFAVGTAFVACTRNEPVQPIVAQDAGTPVSATFPLDAAVIAEADAAGARTSIGYEGGTFEGDGVRIILPEGATATQLAIKIRRAPDSELPSWPPGTALGFTFEGAGASFRLPVKIEFPHQDVSGEVMCQRTTGERHTDRFDKKPGPKPFRVEVLEIPERCAVYSLEHMNAHKASETQSGVIISKLNQSYKWEMKGKICDPHELVRPNAGREISQPPGEDGCPPGMAKIPNRDACVDRWEAHLVEMMDDGTERTWSPYFNPAGLNVKAKSAPAAIPQGYISQIQATQACKNANKRMCADDEWVAACKGTKGTQFPYGNDEKRGTCNDHRDQHPAMEYLESHDLSVFTKLEHPCINQLPDSELPAGAKKECKTEGGAFDMVGNLHEWTADPSGHFRGGYYVDTWLNGHGCDYVTTRHEARYWDYSTGFRCCADLSK